MNKTITAGSMPQQFFSSIPDIMFVLDRTGRFLYWHTPQNVETGSAEPLFSQRLTEALPPEYVDAALAEIDVALQTNSQLTSEYELLTGGEARVFERRLVPCEGERVLMLVRDITQRKRADQALRNNQHYFQSMDRVHRVMARAKSVNELIRDVVDEVLAIFAVDRAWLIHPCDPLASSWRVPVEATRPEYPGACAEGISIPMDEASRRVFAKALGTTEPVVYDFTSDVDEMVYLQRFQIRAQLCVVMHPRFGQAWLLGMHQCSYKRCWTEEDKRLLRDIAERVTDSLTNIALLEQLEKDVREREFAERRALQLLEQNRSLTRSLFEVQEQERRNLARELHDEFGQWLAAINIHAQLMQRLIGEQNSEARECAQVIVDCSGELQRQSRAVLRRLRPCLLEGRGLEEGLRELVELWQRGQPEIACDLHIDLPAISLDEALSTTVYRLIQEALTNVAKHASARHVSVSLAYCPAADGARMLRVEVEDDGKGFIPGTSSGGYGLAGMNERVLAYGGTFQLTKAPGTGLRLKVELPLN